MDDTNTIIGNYRILSPIASGTFGRVYLAQHHILTQRIVALKLIHEQPLANKQDFQMLLHEAQILEMLQDPHILPILDAGLYEGRLYIVSEYAAGNSLRKRIQEQGSQPFPLDTALKWIEQIGQGLQYAHDRQVIHRDLKPENILFNTENQALLADFGLATLLTTTSMKRVTNAGTPRYMAPEQFQGMVSKASDQYALGCIAYELFTGHVLFEAADPLALMYAHNYTMPLPLTQYNPSLPASIEQAVLKALMKDRNERHANITTFLASLQASGNTLTAIREISTPQSALPQTSLPEQEISESDLSTLVKLTNVQDKEQTRKEEFIQTTGSFLRADQVFSQETFLLPSDAGSSAKLEIIPATPLVPQKSVPASHPAPQRKGVSRWFVLAACLILSISVSSSLFFFWQTITVHGRLQTQGNTASFVQTRSTTQPGATITSTATSSTIVAPTAHTAPTTQPTPIPTPTLTPHAHPTPIPTPKPLHTISYFICGDQVSLTNNNYWNTVQPGSTVSTTDYSGPVNSYTGPSGDPGHSSGNCSGLYHWAWDQHPVQAMWTWTNAYLPAGMCKVAIHIPSWYAGAPDALYSLLVNSDTTSNSYTFSPQNQNQISTTWVTLLINHQAQSLSLPQNTSGLFSLTLTLANGGTPNWYLGADAIQFDCSYRA